MERKSVEGVCFVRVYVCFSFGIGMKERGVRGDIHGIGLSEKKSIYSGNLGLISSQ